MDYIAAQRLVWRSYCPEPSCEGSVPVVVTDPGQRYIVVCSTDRSHTLTLTKAQFQAFLERWRQGERLFSLEGLMFENALNVRARWHQRWEYECDKSGAIIRIGNEWWPGYKEKDMDQSLVVHTPQQIDIIREQVAPDATPEQFAYFMAVARRSGLDPLRGQLYAVFFRRRDQKEKEMAIITAIDGYRAIAARTGLYAGSDDPTFGPTENDHPSYATVTIYKLVGGQRVAFTATCRWEEFAYESRDGKRQVKQRYAERPWHQLAVRTESHALRKGFPEDMWAVDIEPPEYTMVDTVTGEIGPEHPALQRMQAYHEQELDVIAALERDDAVVETVDDPIADMIARLAAVDNAVDFATCRREINSWPTGQMRVVGALKAARERLGLK